MLPFGKKYFYSPETYNLLNLMTLKINDKEIEREYQLYQVKRFNFIMKWVYRGFFLTMLIAWLFYFTGRSELYEALRPTHLIINITILWLAQLFCGRHTPKFWIIAQIPTLTLV